MITCSRCGKRLDNDTNATVCALRISVTNNSFSKDMEDLLKSNLGPYHTGDYSFCYECILEILQVPKPKA